MSEPVNAALVQTKVDDDPPPPWPGHAAPPEILNYIFDLAASLPRYADFDKTGVLHPDDYFDASMCDRWSIRADEALRRSVRVRIAITHVRRDWRRSYIEKAYERIHLNKPSQMALLAEVLEKSCTVSLPAGYGGWTKQLSWRLPAVKGGKYPLEDIQAMVKIVRHCPKLQVFCPSPHIGSMNVPSEVLDVLVEKEITQSLQSFRLLGLVDLVDLYKLFTKSSMPALTSVTLGRPWNGLGNVGFSLPGLRSLHVEINHGGSSPPSNYLKQFTQGFLPQLEHLFIVYRHYNHHDWIEQLLDVHGEKLKFLRLDIAKSYFRGHIDLPSILNRCPHVTDLIANFPWFEGFDRLGKNTPLCRLGFSISQEGSSSPVRPALVMQKFLEFRDSLSLPKTLRSVRIVDTTVAGLRVKDAEMADFFASWSIGWRERGVMLEDMNGEEFGGRSD